MAKPSDVVASGRSWAKELIALYEDGCSDAEVAAQMRIPLREFYQQITENTAFGKLVEFGRTLSLAFWERQARENIGNKQFNSSLYSFYMKNKHGWAEKVDTSAQTELNVSADELKEKLLKQTAKFVERYSPELTDAQRVLSGVGKTMMEGDDESIQSI